MKAFISACAICACMLLTGFAPGIVGQDKKINLPNRSSDLVEVGGYLTQSNNYYLAGSEYQLGGFADYAVSVNAGTAIYQSETYIRRVELYIRNGTNAANLINTNLATISLGPVSGYTDAFIRSEINCGNIAYPKSGGTLISITPPSPYLFGKMGDYLGIKAQKDGSLVAPRLAMSELDYVPAPAPAFYGSWLGSGSGISDSNSAGCFTIKAYGQAPDMVHIGHSIVGCTDTAGSVWPFIMTAASASNITYDPTKNASYYPAQIYGWVWQNMGKGGDDATGMLARFSTDVIAKKPHFVIISAGAQSWEEDTQPHRDTARAAIVSMCTAALSASPSIKPIVTDILRHDNSVPSTNALIAAQNAQLQADIKAQAPGAIFIDTTDDMVTTDGCLPASYVNADHIHLTPAGQKAWGQAIYKQLHIQLRNSY